MEIPPFFIPQNRKVCRALQCICMNIWIHSWEGRLMKSTVLHLNMQNVGDYLAERERFTNTECSHNCGECIYMKFIKEVADSYISVKEVRVSGLAPCVYLERFYPALAIRVLQLWSDSHPYEYISRLDVFIDKIKNDNKFRDSLPYSWDEEDIEFFEEQREYAENYPTQVSDGIFSGVSKYCLGNLFKYFHPTVVNYDELFSDNSPCTIHNGLCGGCSCTRCWLELYRDGEFGLPYQAQDLYI